MRERFDLGDGYGETKIYLGAETVTRRRTARWHEGRTQYVKNICQEHCTVCQEHCRYADLGKV